AQVPADTCCNDFRLRVASPEDSWSASRHCITLKTCAWRIRTLTRQRAFDKARDNASANDMKPGLWAPVVGEFPKIKRQWESDRGPRRPRLAGQRRDDPCRPANSRRHQGFLSRLSHQREADWSRQISQVLLRAGAHLALA